MIFLTGSMSASTTILLIIAITMSNVGLSKSRYVTCQIDRNDIQQYRLNVERTFSDRLIVTVISRNTGDNWQSMDLHLGRYNFSDSIRSGDEEGRVFWNNRSSPITRCFDVKPAGQSFGCRKCNAVCLEFEQRWQNRLLSDAIAFSIRIKLLYCPASDTLESCKNSVHPQPCDIKVDMELKRGYTIRMHYGGNGEVFTHESPLRREEYEFKNGILYTNDISVMNEERWKNHSYNFYVERTIDDRLIGLIGFANRSTEFAGTFNVSTEQFNAADIQLKCSDGQWISKEYDYVCPIIDPIEYTSCGAIKFRMSFFAISCDEAYRHDGWLCYKNRNIELIQPDMGLNEEIYLGTRINTDGRSVVSTTKPVDPTYNLYNQMVWMNYDYIYKCSIPDGDQEYVVGFERTEQNFIFHFWLHKECQKSKWSKAMAMVKLLYKKIETPLMFRKPSRRFCLNDHAACNRCDKVCLFFYNMNSGLPADPVTFEFKIEHIYRNDKAAAQGGKPVERKGCGTRFYKDVSMKIGDDKIVW